MKTLSELVEEKKNQGKEAQTQKAGILQTLGLVSSIKSLKKQTQISPTKGFLAWFKTVFYDLGVFLKKTTFTSRVVNLDEITKSVDKLGSKTLDVEVKNQLDLTKQFSEISVGIKDLKEKLGSYIVGLDKSIKGISIPEAKDFPKSIAISNKKLSVSVDNLSELKKSIEETNKFIAGVGKIVADKDFPTEMKISNLLDLKKHFDNLQKSVKGIKLPETDFSPVIQSVESVKKAIEEMRFPVPNFKSSWSHSIAMQLKDAPKAFTYDGSNLSYVEANFKGKTYRKTFTYSGSTLTNTTNWEEQ